jgi:orotate phosphoribosyltransferase
VDWLADLHETGALLEGHFELTSGRHSDRFLLLSRLVAHPERLRPWLAPLAEFARGVRPTVVVGPAMGGVILAWVLAEVLGEPVWAAFAEKAVGGEIVIRRGFQLTGEDRAVIIEDALTTGGSVLRTRDAVERSGAEVAAAVTLVDRRPPDVEFPLPLRSTLRWEAPAYEPAACPLCERGAAPAQRPKLY